MGPQRKSPDMLLAAIRQEENAARRGRLKIFFGYAAGVGKTFAMLKAAHAERQRGTDVVVGYAEPHARPRTSALLSGLERLPFLSAAHGGITLEEFDLDAAIARKPELILVDEFAHTNADGCRHAKRYQDVNELLALGINVYTTVNVQHIESLNDIVASVTGILVRERIPDSVFDSAYQVEFVDIEPQDLIERLKAGDVYGADQTQRAVANFFTADNLAALREIALRRCADRLNLLSERARVRKNKDYHTDEHILVCVSSAPSNTKLIRTAARMAGAFQSAFTALFVETPDFAAMTEKDRDRLRTHIRLAQQLGASIETVFGDDVPFQIAEFARLSGVSKIVIGRSAAQRRSPFFKPTLTERLIALAPNTDIHIIPDAGANRRYRAKKAAERGPLRISLRDMGVSVLILLAATLIGLCFSSLSFTEANIITVYILAVLMTAIVTSSRICSLLASVVSVLVFNFFFTAPQYSLLAYDKGYPVTFAIMFLSALLTGSLAARLKKHAAQSAKAAYRTKVLLDTNQLLQKARDKEGIVSVTAGQLIKLLGRDVIAYLAENGALGEPRVFPAGGEDDGAGALSSNERAVAGWVLKNNRHAGATTDTLHNAKCLYLAVRLADHVFGVVGIVVGERPLDAFENSVMLSILGECALALENEKNAREKAEAAARAKNEQLRADLLRAISHDLRTPLTSISGNASNLISNGGAFDEATKARMYTDIYDDSMWLMNLVENLLSVSRIEEGRIHLNVSAELMDEVVAEALRHLDRRSGEHNITYDSSDEFIFAQVDAKLIVQVLINVVDNAVKYTPAGSDIRITARKRQDTVEVRVSDNGPGIPDEIKPRVFDMFYSGSNKLADSRRSLGLGLSLCRSIIRAHGGDIRVDDNAPRGAAFTFTLPAREVILHE